MNPFNANTTTEQPVEQTGIDPTVMAGEIATAEAPKKEVKRLPSWAVNTKKELLAGIDPMLVAKAASLVLTQNATREVLFGAEGYEDYATKILGGLYFGCEVDTKTRDNFPLTFRIAPKASLIEELYEALPEEVKKAANNKTADGEKIKKTSILEGVMELISKGVPKDVACAAFKFTAKQIAILDKRLSGLDTTKDEEELEQQA